MELKYIRYIRTDVGSMLLKFKRQMTELRYENGVLNYVPSAVLEEIHNIVNQHL